MTLMAGISTLSTELRNVPIELAQDRTRHDDHDRILDALDVFAKLLDDATVVDEYVRIEYDV